MEASVQLSVPTGDDIKIIFVDVEYEVCMDVGAKAVHPEVTRVIVPEELKDNDEATKWLHSAETCDFIQELLRGAV